MTSDAERIAVLEADQRHMEMKIDHMAAKVDEMHEVLLQARGARWAIIGVAGMAGFLGSKIAYVAALLGIKLP